ncbi:Golgi to ER traffic protein 4 homolog isoform X2 [Corticium candelabrum]|uniref:Golgi to ER traffic protein 4 homolog isoform X2 n=1 Tax=Corticium candelabrum TaxID=121492 RepID=UPI002E336412|nr:Golgi to ER traffic protein 4 homolog isoform X2 [Corticium candelabrum]
MATHNRKGGGTVRVLEKAERRLEEGKYYEAHQMYRTVYYRFMGQKRNDEALNLVHKGASLLLEHKQFGSGLDLCLLTIERFITDKIAVSDERLDQLAQLFHLFDGQEKPRAKFINAAIKWSSGGGDGYRYGHPYLHQLVALACWKEGNYERARHHFLYADQMKDFSHMLIEMSTKLGYPGEYDLFITQAVLHLLVLQKVAVAHGVFVEYVDQHLAFPESTPPYKIPLLNFLWLLFRAIERKSVGVFRLLRVLYKPSLDRDEDYTLVGTFFFDEAVPPASQGLLDSIFGTMLSVFTDADGTDVSAGAQLDVNDSAELD